MNDLTTYNKTELVFANPELTKRANIIREEYNKVLVSANKVGKALAEIKAGEYFKEDGYRRLEDFTEEVFGIKRAQAYNLIKGYEIGEKKLLLDADGKAQKLCTEFSNTQCVEMSKIKEEKDLAKLLADKAITSDMSTKKIRDIVDKFLHPDKAEKTEEVTEETTEETTEEKENFDNIILQASIHDGKLVIDTFESKISAKDVDKIRMLLEKYVK